LGAGRRVVDLTGHGERQVKLICAEAQRDAALAAAQEIDDERARAHVLAALAEHLTTDQRDAALAAAQEIDDERARAHVLAALAEHLTTDQRADVLKRALALTEPQNRVDVLIRLLPLPETAGERPAQVWRDLLAAAAVLGRPHVTRVGVSLLPLILQLGGPRAVKIMLAWQEATGRWWP
jgi:hypothetical protein